MRVSISTAGGTEGHRVEYLTVLKHALASQHFEVVYCDSLLTRPLLIPMIESEKFRFLFAAFANIFISAPVTGLLFRTRTLVQPISFLHRLKKQLLLQVMKIPRVTVLTIMPHLVDQSLALISHDWIYDPQLWDLDILPLVSTNTPPQLLKQLKTLASGRRIVVALGSQSRIKATDRFLELWLRKPAIRQKFLFVIAGSIDADFTDLVKDFQATGGFVINRHINPMELLFMYKHADVIWSCYAKHYDQASGIFGRAVQCCVPALVRQGSYLEALAQHLSHPVLSLNLSSLDDCCDRLSSWTPKNINRDEQHLLVRKMRCHSINVLKMSLVD